MPFLTSNPVVSRIVVLTQAQLESITAAQLADYTAIYQLDAAPFTKYYSNGTSLVISTMTTSDVDALIAANSQLGAMAPAVQALIDASDITNRARENHTGIDSAANVILASGQTLEAWKTAVDTVLAGVSASAPVNTVAPTAPTGSLSVTSTLTANQGTWTGAASYAYQWRLGGIAIVGATSSTYVLRPSDTAGFMTCTVTATASNGLSNSATSPAVGPVTSTLPTISVAPAVTPSGTQAVGTLLTTTNGTWTNGGGATYTYQWYFNSAVIIGATLNTYTPVAGQEGGSIFVLVWATTAQGTSAAGAQSNTITTSASPTVANSSVPAWSGTLYMSTPNLFTPGVWTGSIQATRSWAFFRNTATTPYATSTVASHTPASPAVVGDTLYIEETVTSSVNGITYTARSAGSVIQAVPATLSAQQAVTNITWTVGTPITSVTPVTATGGTTPYTFSIKAGTTALPTGLSINSSTGAITGTPSGAVTQTTYTVQIVDAAGSPATVEASFIATTQAATAYPIGPQAVTASNPAIGTRYAAVGASNAACTLANPGSLRQALTGAVAGDVVFLRGGTYNMQTIGGGDYALSANGTSGSRITVESYPGEWAVLDGMATGWHLPADRSFFFTGSYWTWRNLEIKRQTSFYGLYVGGNNNIFENVHCLENLATGMIIEGSNNIVRSCRFNDNDGSSIAEMDFGGDTDGIADRGTNNVIEYCEALRNSDDGYDSYFALNSVIRYCVGSYNGLGLNGNGNGFKLGGAGTLPTYGNPDFHHCIAFGNLRLGFDVSAAPSAEIRYCTAWNNGTRGFSWMSDTLVNNCIAAANVTGPFIVYVTASPSSNISNNSWASPFGNAPTFISVTYGNIDFLRPIVGGGYESIGAFA